MRGGGKIQSSIEIRWLLRAKKKQAVPYCEASFFENGCAPPEAAVLSEEQPRPNP
jgi:hypothetical protein